VAWEALHVVNENISVSELDQLVEEIGKREVEKEQIELQLTEKNKEISKLQLRATEVLKSLEREEYDSPHGKISFEEVFSIRQPSSDDEKRKLFEWMREREIFDRYATVNANSLKALFKAERNAAIDAGEDPMTFALPGMEPATIFEKLKFRPKKGK
jgi:hypothetical protein